MRVEVWEVEINEEDKEVDETRKLVGFKEY